MWATFGPTGAILAPLGTHWVDFGATLASLWVTFRDLLDPKSEGRKNDAILGAKKVRRPKFFGSKWEHFGIDVGASWLPKSAARNENAKSEQ